MIIYFEEEDLVSFGQYMVSDKRRKLFEEHPEPTGTVEERLKTVHDADLANWAYLRTADKLVDAEIANENRPLN